MLTYQEAPEFIWLWGNLLAALAIARAAPDGRFQKFARAYRTLSFAVLGHRAAAVPVAAGALRAVSAARRPAMRSYGIMANDARPDASRRAMDAPGMPWR